VKKVATQVHMVICSYLGGLQTITHWWKGGSVGWVRFPIGSYRTFEKRCLCSAVNGWVQAVA